ncbi:MAG: hypothetical protein A3B16_02470 [Candidatus Zambryskibacteria bacterium RIFCSPLOWO2_01_FULL_45_43]|uniref:Uncharacterized protein n=2 Tax=Parcubacteria group TaxID=1794811 RepID=A0A1G1ZU71_9BACT|nr:MAG: hypothetical protein A3H63_01750 [Candidatus Harrisonbacteria bacterium RIFCSPLOWO2_02_FULL_45_10c]OHB04941.1 MAG: hypothetical protein A3B16_02470 [Candidatus Zambryskibacteria bacterium RIFCSPLOWO2_01_FULL_45_43]
MPRFLSSWIIGWFKPFKRLIFIDRFWRKQRKESVAGTTLPAFLSGVISQLGQALRTVKSESDIRIGAFTGKAIIF